MNIAGFQKITLLDYPSKVACTIFTSGCNLRCPFCHNSSIVLGTDTKLNETDIFRFLEKRVGLLDAVCISGGEPTLQPDLKGFIKNVKELEFLVKLDTNGTNYNKLVDLIESKLVDYVAMDIKNCIPKYAMTCGVQNVNIEQIQKSINYLINSDFDYEFRTTILKDYHTEADMVRISEMLKGCKRYYLQKFLKSNSVIDSRCEELQDSDILKYLEIVRENIPQAEVRGIAE